MNIISALTKIDGMRISYQDKWLTWDNDEWVVYQRKYGAKKSIILCRTPIQDDAIKVLCNDSN